ncbi:beta-galactosidase, partial [candidate division KSB3 bacterium]
MQIASRQVHLDFHTSEHLPSVGRLFERQQFQQALKRGHLNSITVFAKCHHSWSYYPTKIGKAHPTLEIDLLGNQIEACHEIGVRAPIYFTVGWSANDAETHPEWCVRQKDGSIHTTGWDADAQPNDRRPIVSWKFMCPTGDYLDLIVKQTQEICECYPVDGFFYDITNGPPCYCETCRRGMEAEQIDLDDIKQVIAYNDRKWKHFFSECQQTIQRQHPEATLFFNGTTLVYADKHNRDCSSGSHEYNTHHELEDLPTTWAGYDKLPLRAKFFHGTGKALLGMSGKFHTTWGEFGGFKHPDAIRYEAASMLAFGAGCSFGDQLHP